MRACALLVFALWCVPALLLAQGDAATGDVVAAVRTESGAPLAEAEVRSDSSGTLTDAQEVGQVALDLSYVGRQALEDDPYRTVSRPHLIVGFLAMNRVGSTATVFLNSENLLNVR